MVTVCKLDLGFLNSILALCRVGSTFFDGCRRSARYCSSNCLHDGHGRHSLLSAGFSFFTHGQGHPHKCRDFPGPSFSDHRKSSNQLAGTFCRESVWDLALPRRRQPQLIRIRRQSSRDRSSPRLVRKGLFAACRHRVSPLIRVSQNIDRPLLETWKAGEIERVPRRLTQIHLLVRPGQGFDLQQRETGTPGQTVTSEPCPRQNCQVPRERLEAWPFEGLLRRHASEKQTQTAISTRSIDNMYETTEEN